MNAVVTLAQLGHLRCRPVSVELGVGPSAQDVMRRAAAAGADGLVCLRGRWADGGAIVAASPLVVLPADGDPFAVLGVAPRVSPAAEGVVGGGWVGWLAYDGVSRLAFYDHVLRMDRAGRWWFEALWSAERAEFLATRQLELSGLLTGPVPILPWQVGDLGGASRAAHLAGVENAVELIRAGEIYQVNVCTRLSGTFGGSPAGLFADAVSALRPAFGAFVDGGQRVLAALSPELFVRRRGRSVTTSPIKGTWPSDDPDGAQALRESTKDSAENVMIVDLMRNDLGRVCAAGGVRVPSLLDVQRHPGVLHLVSTVTGRLRADVGDAELLRAVFPPGSVTGVPKLRAMAAIRELEGTPRGVYTGAVGFVSPCWGAEWAVVIRSFEIADGRIELGVGGGVTADSVPMLEWRECLHKAAPLVAAVRSRLVEDIAVDVATATAGQLVGGLTETVACRAGVPVRLADHLGRLDRSALELYRRGVPASTATLVRAAARDAVVNGPVVNATAVRVWLGADGECRVTEVPARPAPAPSVLSTVTRKPGLWRHRWADRAQPDDDVVFLAEDGAVLQTGRGNLFLIMADGTLVTPPLRDDLLPGVTRRALLDHARDEGRPVRLRCFDIDELLAHPAFWTSSLAGAVPIAEVDGRRLPRRDNQIIAFADHLLAASRAHR